MANPQKENGYTAIANELVEAMARCDCFGFSSSQITWAVLRQTYGWHKTEDSISISQLQEMTGLARRTIIYSIQELEAKKIFLVVRERKGQKNLVNRIKFNKDYDTWVVQNSAPQVEKNRKIAKERSAKLRTDVMGSAKLRQKVVQNSVKDGKSFAPTKETTKRKTTNTSKTEVLRGKEWNELIDSFKEVNPMYEDFYQNRTERAALDDMAKKWGFDKLKATIEELPKIIGQPYAPRITKPSELRRDIGKLVAFYNQEKNKNKITNETPWKRWQ